MACLPSILCLGEDPDLLRTRAMVLKRLGAEVKSTTSIKEALEYVAGENFNLIVLCHSLKQSDAVAISSATCEQNPPPLILQITKSFDYEEERAQIWCDAVVDTDPASLTDRAKELLLRRSQPAKPPRAESTFRDGSTIAAHH